MSSTLGTKLFADVSNAIGGYFGDTATSVEQSAGIYTDNAIHGKLVSTILKYRDVQEAVKNGTGSEKFQSAYAKFKEKYGDILEKENLPTKQESVELARKSRSLLDSPNDVLQDINSRLAMLNLQLQL